MLLLVMLLLVSGSSFVHSRHLDVAASSSSIAANGKQTDDKLNADDVSRSREQDGVDGVALFDGLKLASIRYTAYPKQLLLNIRGMRFQRDNIFKKIYFTGIEWAKRMKSWMTQETGKP